MRFKLIWRNNYIRGIVLITVIIMLNYREVVNNQHYNNENIRFTKLYCSNIINKSTKHITPESQFMYKGNFLMIYFDMFAYSILTFI